MAAEEALNVDSGFLGTLVALSTSPGTAVREYIGGRTRDYANPFKYLLVSVALATVVGVYFNVTELGVGLGGLSEAENAAVRERVADLSSRLFNVIIAGAVPFLALASFLLFRRSRLNAAEHLIFNTFILAQQNFIFLVTVPLLFIPAITAAWYSVGYTIVISLYYVWACVGFFQIGRWGGIWRGTVSVALGYIFYFIFVVIVISAYTVTLERVANARADLRLPRAHHQEIEEELHTLSLGGEPFNLQPE